MENVRLIPDRAKDYLSFSQLKNFRYSLINQGFDVENVSLAGSSDIPDDIEIVVIADLTKPLEPGNRKS